MPARTSCLASLVPLALIPTATAAIDVGGTITTTTWAKATSPYVVTGAVTVPAGNKLTIEPGVDVLFDADVPFVIEGHLVAVGTEADSIRFLVSAENDSGEWGGIRISGEDSSRLEYVRISDGHAQGDSLNGCGGGLYGSLVAPGRILLSHCLVSGSRADVFGGGIYLAGGGELSHCTLRGNHASQSGGGASVYGAYVTMTRCLIVSNSADQHGGALRIEGDDSEYRMASLWLANCTVTGSTAGDGEGHAAALFGPSELRVLNSIVWDPISTFFADPYSGTSIFASYSCVLPQPPPPGWWERANVYSDPLFVDAANGDYRLRAESPCIDAGPPGPPYDPDGTWVDVGALPFQHTEGRFGLIPTTTWSKDGSPYRITGPVTVLPEATLTIEPGVEVLFDADVWFVVQGSLRAIGAAEDTIRFARGVASEWGGMRFEGTGSSALVYARVADANPEGQPFETNGGAVFVAGQVYPSPPSGPSLELSHTLIDSNRGSAAVFAVGATLTMADCIVERNDGGGVYLDVDAHTAISRCRIVGNGGWTDLVGGFPLSCCNSVVGRVDVAGSASFSSCTIGGLSGQWWSLPGSPAVLLENTVVSAFMNQPPYPDAIVARYCCLPPYGGGAAGPGSVGNVLADPKFVDPANGDYRLQLGSPCINRGDPQGTRDPDGSIADIGALPFDLTAFPDVVTGYLLTDTISGGTWRAKNSVIVPAGNTVTVEPGTNVLFDAEARLVVEGSLRAAGTETDSIRFLPAEPAGWQGVYLTGNGASAVRYARVSGVDAIGSGGYPPPLNDPAQCGALYATGSPVLELADLVVTGNRAPLCGGIRVDAAQSATLARCLIRDNRTDQEQGAGLSITMPGSAWLDGCTVVSNRPPGAAGSDVVLQPLGATLSRCVLEGVRVEWGTAASLTHCTVADGLALRDAGSLTLSNTIVSGGISGSLYGTAPSATLQYSAVYPWAVPLGFTEGPGNIGSDPMFIDPGNDDYRVRSPSPCIDAGDPYAILDPDGTRADIGAIPFEHVRGSIPTSNWTKPNSPYRVGGAITIPAGDTLTIEPGVDVLLDTDAPLVVEGVLYALGTEADSIRFLAGAGNDSAEWGGIRISGGDSSRLEYVRISDADADGWTTTTSNGGAVAVSDVGTIVVMKNAVIGYNRAVGVGGGLWVANAMATLDRCAIVDNSAPEVGGACVEGVTAILRMANCTVADNVSVSGGAVEARASGAAVLVNCIVWGNTSPGLFKEGGSTLAVTYSDVQDAYSTTDGNISAEPLFSAHPDSAYRLTGGSPCIDSGDPASPLDPDDTRADMGAFVIGHFVSVLTLPTVSAWGGDTVLVSIGANVKDAYSVDLAFLIDPAVLEPLEPFLRWHAFAGQSPVEVAANVIENRVKVSVAAEYGVQGITLRNEPLVELAFVVRPTSLPGAHALAWLAYPSTNVNEAPVTVLENGTVAVGAVYGDVSGDRQLTAFDAAMILQYVVEIRPSIDVTMADVSANGFISSFDAALVLRKMLDTSFVFPVEGGSLPRRATPPTLVLRWHREDAGWVLTADHAGMLSGEVTFALSSDAPVSVSGGNHVAFKQAGPALRAAFVRLDGDDAAVLRITSAVPMNVPQITLAQFNEGRFSYTVVRPAEFALGPNVPNPFNPTTSIRFSIPDAGHVTLVVYDVNGRLVRTLVDGPADEGDHEVVWDGTDARGRSVASGVYLYRLTNRHGLLVKKMLLVR